MLQTLNAHLSPAQIRAALRAPLPGWLAQSRMLPIPRDARPLGSHPRVGAVLLALVDAPAQTKIALIVRASHARHHGGQVAFPGGAVEADDASLWACALREAHEEIGLAPSAVECLGALTPISISSSGFLVHPFVGWVWQKPTAWLPAPAEVAAVLEVPLHALLQRTAHDEETWRIAERTVRVPFYRAAGHIVWGASAMMLSELETALRACLPQERANDHP